MAEIQDFERHDGVYILTTDTFESFIKEKKNVLMDFYAHWCPPCQALAPEYCKAAQTLDGDEINVVLAKIDCSVHTEIGKKYSI